MTRQADADVVGLLDLWPEVVARRAAFLETIDVTEEQARRQLEGKPEEWCILQVAQHVLGWTENVTNLIEALAAGRIAPKCPPGFTPNDLPDSIVAIAHGS